MNKKISLWFFPIALIWIFAFSAFGIIEAGSGPPTLDKILRWESLMVIGSPILITLIFFWFFRKVQLWIIIALSFVLGALMSVEVILQANKIDNLGGEVIFTILIWPVLIITPYFLTRVSDKSKAWKIAIVSLLSIFLIVQLYRLSNSHSPTNVQSQRPNTIVEKPQYLVYFPAKVEDFATPAKMYGLWPYGVKGSNSQSHNEGHPGWDFELKKGTKLYAVSDLRISQIHDGDHVTDDITPKVIEAMAELADGNYHIVYHSVTNIELNVVEGATVKAGSIIAEAGYPLSDTTAMIHFGVFPPGDSVGACPSPYFTPELQPTIQRVVDLSRDMNTGKPYASACVGKINRELYEQNYPSQVQHLGGAEQWE